MKTINDYQAEAEIDANTIRILRQHVSRLQIELAQIRDMAMGDGLDYCRSLTDPRPMTQAEMINHASVIRGCFMGIASKARAALAPC